MSPACGHLSVFRGKRSVLVSLEGPARWLLVSGAPGFPGPGAPQVRRLPSVRTPGAAHVGRPASQAALRRRPATSCPRPVLSASLVGTPVSPAGAPRVSPDGIAVFPAVAPVSRIISSG